VNPADAPLETGDAPSVRELVVAEDAGWNELHGLIESLTPEEVERPGYYPEGWSAKDLLAHVGSWLAEAGVVLDRIRAETYQPQEIDVDALNEAFLDAMRDVPLPEVRAQAAAARTRMLQELRGLDRVAPEAAFWIRKSGAEHYGEHLPRLREWVTELRSA
jgi:hypothetical protein